MPMNEFEIKFITLIKMNSNICMHGDMQRRLYIYIVDNMNGNNVPGRVTYTLKMNKCNAAATIYIQNMFQQGSLECEINDMQFIQFFV